MNRFIKVFLITIIIGFGIFFVSNMIKEKKVEADTEKFMNSKNTFDVSYAKEVTVEELKDVIESGRKIVLFIGEKDKEATINVSANLKKLSEEYDLEIYYLEKDADVINNPVFKETLNNYEELENYVDFTPLLITFGEKKYLASYPGEGSYRNLYNLIEYSKFI